MEKCFCCGIVSPYNVSIIKEKNTIKKMESIFMQLSQESFIHAKSLPFAVQSETLVYVKIEVTNV